MDDIAHADTGASRRPQRADARRNVDALLEAARTVFELAGVDAPAKQITDLAGVGVGTLYRHFPQRSDLVVAVLEREIDACADAATAMSSTDDPASALAAWLDRYTTFLRTKHGLAQALHSDDPAFATLRDHMRRRMEPALRPLLRAAFAAGHVRDDLDAQDLLRAVALLSLPVPGADPEFGRRMVAVFVDGLRRGSARDQ